MFNKILQSTYFYCYAKLYPISNASQLDHKKKKSGVTISDSKIKALKDIQNCFHISSASQGNIWYNTQELPVKQYIRHIRFTETSLDKNSLKDHTSFTYIDSLAWDNAPRVTKLLIKLRQGRKLQFYDQKFKDLPREGKKKTKNHEKVNSH